MAWYDELGNIGAQIGAYGGWPIGLGIGRPPGGYMGGYPQPPLRPGGIPPSPGGAAPGAGLPTPQPVTPGAPLGLGVGRPPGGYAGGYGPSLGDIGAQVGAMGNWPSAQGSMGWNPATAIPPGMAQYGMSPHSGLLGSLGGMGADVGRVGNWPNATGQANVGPLPPDKVITDLRPPSGPLGTKGEPPSPNQPQPIYPPGSPLNKTPPPAPKRKPKPKPRVQAGNQARNTSWETHSEAYNPIQGTFGHQAWRTPKR